MSRAENKSSGEPEKALASQTIKKRQSKVTTRPGEEERVISCRN
jgi:hypothetical protein